MNFCVRYLDLPFSIKGLTVMDKDGFCNIYINSRLSLETQREALHHELTHVSRSDFDRLEESIQAVESM